MRQLRDDGNLVIDHDLLKLDRFAVGEVQFDNVSGAGSVPMMANLHYMGVMATITPRTFLDLTPGFGAEKRPGTVSFLETNEGPLGSPFLIINTQGHEDMPAVSGHEGRHRMWWIANHYGEDFEVPVGLFIREGNYSLRAREIDQELIEKISLGCFKEKASYFVEGPIYKSACWSNGSFNIENPKEPGMVSSL